MAYKQVIIRRIYIAITRAWPPSYCIPRDKREPRQRAESPEVRLFAVGAVDKHNDKYSSTCMRVSKRKKDGVLSTVMIVYYFEFIFYEEQAGLLRMSIHMSVYN